MSTHVQPLTITSAGHPMAISAYALIAVFGLTYVVGVVQSPRMEGILTPVGMSLWALAVFLAGGAALGAVLVTPRLRVPLVPVLVEQATVSISVLPFLGSWFYNWPDSPLWVPSPVTV